MDIDTCCSCEKLQKQNMIKAEPCYKITKVVLSYNATCNVLFFFQQFLRECESNLPIFEKMTTEAGYIIDQPNMQKELETLQRRWNDVLTASEERSHRVDKMQGAWVAYNQEVNNIEEVLEKFDNRLAAEPNVNSTDPQVIEHELALCKVRENLKLF